MAWRFETDCVHADGVDIAAMVNEAKEVKFCTVMDTVGRDAVREVFPDYNWTGNKGGLALRNDYHVRYFKSRYRGRYCYFITHSAIEYVFTWN